MVIPAKAFSYVTYYYQFQYQEFLEGCQQGAATAVNHSSRWTVTVVDKEKLWACVRMVRGLIYLQRVKKRHRNITQLAYMSIDP